VGITDPPARRSFGHVSPPFCRHRHISRPRHTEFQQNDFPPPSPPYQVGRRPRYRA
jgi:hypothetical protein